MKANESEGDREREDKIDLRVGGRIYKKRDIQQMRLPWISAHSPNMYFFIT